MGALLQRLDAEAEKASDLAAIAKRAVRAAKSQLKNARKLFKMRKKAAKKAWEKAAAAAESAAKPRVAKPPAPKAPVSMASAAKATPAKAKPAKAKPSKAKTAKAKPVKAKPVKATRTKATLKESARKAVAAAGTQTQPARKRRAPAKPIRRVNPRPPAGPESMLSAAEVAKSVIQRLQGPPPALPPEPLPAPEGPLSP